MRLTQLIFIGLVTISSVAVAQSLPARVNCLDSQLSSSTITTLRSDVRFEYLAPTIKVTDSKNQPFSQLHSLLTLGGNNLSTQLLFLAKDQSNKWGLYFTDARITLRAGKAELLAPANEPGSVLSYFESRKLKNGVTALSKNKNLVVFPYAKTNTYAILDRNNANLINPLTISSANAANPRFSLDEKYLIFDQLNAAKNLVQQVIVDLNSQKQIVISGKDSNILEAFVAHNNIFWVELFEKNYGREKTWSLKTASLDKSTQVKSLVESLATENDLIPPFAWASNGTNSTFMFLEERFERNSNTGDVLLKKGLLKIYKLDSLKATVAPFETYPYSTAVANFALKFAEFGGGLQFARYHQSSNSLIFAGGNKSGLVKFDLNTKNWSIHAAAVDISQCYQPSLGDEVN